MSPRAPFLMPRNDVGPSKSGPPQKLTSKEDPRGSGLRPTHSRGPLFEVSRILLDLDKAPNYVGRLKLNRAKSAQLGALTALLVRTRLQRVRRAMYHRAYPISFTFFLLKCARAYRARASEVLKPDLRKKTASGALGRLPYIRPSTPWAVDIGLDHTPTRNQSL